MNTQMHGPRKTPEKPGGNAARRSRVTRGWRVSKYHLAMALITIAISVALFYTIRGLNAVPAEPTSDKDKITIEVKYKATEKPVIELDAGYTGKRELEINSEDYNAEKYKAIKFVNPPSSSGFSIVCLGCDPDEKVSPDPENSRYSRPYPFKKSLLFSIKIDAPLKSQETIAFVVGDIVGNPTTPARALALARNDANFSNIFDVEMLLSPKRNGPEPTPTQSPDPTPTVQPPDSDSIRIPGPMIFLLGAVAAVFLWNLWSLLKEEIVADRNNKDGDRKNRPKADTATEWSESRPNILTSLLQSMGRGLQKWRSGNRTQEPRQSPVSESLRPSPSNSVQRTDESPGAVNIPSYPSELTRKIDVRQSTKGNEFPSEVEITREGFKRLMEFIQEEDHKLFVQLNDLRREMNAPPVSQIPVPPANYAVEQQFTSRLESEKRHLSELIELQAAVQQEAVSGLRSEVAKLGRQAHSQVEQHAALKQAIESLKRTLDQPQQQDDFWPSILGGLLEGIVTGQDLSALIDQTGAKLNQFFKEQIPPADVLGDIPDRVANIGAAIGMVAEAAAKPNEAVAKSKMEAVLEAASKIRSVAVRVGAVADTMCKMKEQLKNRQVTIPIEIQVSVHQNARYTFLEELGRAIKQGIDSLREPQLYGERELERIIKNDVIEVVDICDLELNSRGGIREIEAALSELFSAARLKPILPARNEPFQAIKHDLIRYMDDPTVDSQSVVEVVRRGFYRLDVDQQQPFRKATVLVSR